MTAAVLGPAIDRAAHVVLVINDDPASRYATVRVLQNAGFRTREAATGAGGLAEADDSIAAIVLDIHLPDIDGLEMVRHLRERPSTARTPVIHLTAAYTSDEDKVRGLDSGADAYLTHPVEPAVLVASLQALVRARAAEAAMSASERKFRAVYDQAPGGIALVARDGRILDANPAMLDFLGRTLEHTAGRGLVSFVEPDDREPVQAWLHGEQPGELEFALRDAEGKVTDLLWRLSRNVEPGVDLLVAVDVSRRRQAELERQRMLDSERMARTVAERISRVKDELIAVLSHELRSPLNAIMGWTHVLLKRGGDAVTQRGLAAVERNVRMQARLISDILDMSRLAMGKLRLSLESMDPTEAAEDAMTALRDTAEEAGVQLDLQAGRLTAIRADRARVQQIVWNLVSNAIKFSPRGATVTVRLSDEADGVRISVTDQGRGIAPDFLPELFDRFTQDDSGRNRQHGGMGLGLSIVRQLAEAHGGAVDAYSAGTGQGARFDVYLPATAVAGAPADTVHETETGSLAEPEAEVLAGLRVLVVDDDQDACAMLRMILGEHGALVTTVTSVDEALDVLGRGPQDVLVSDVGMPLRDGYELLREVRRREQGGARRLPAIALTSFSRPQDVEQALQAGFDVHSGKPLRPLKLVHAIARLVAGPAPR